MGKYVGIRRSGSSRVPPTSRTVLFSTAFHSYGEHRRLHARSKEREAARNVFSRPIMSAIETVLVSGVVVEDNLVSAMKRHEYNKVTSYGGTYFPTAASRSTRP